MAPFLLIECGVDMEINEIAPGIGQAAVGIANVYFVGKPESPWFLVDTGVPKKADQIFQAAEKRYGTGIRPECILLTHGHFDHAGSAAELASAWDVSLYVHPLEMPYVTGEAQYPPKDPTVGGAMAFASRFFPQKKLNLQPRLKELPAGGEVPGMPEWKWFHTPGHAPGQVAFWQESTRVLLAGDAFATADLDSISGLVRQKPEISRPPAPFTYDWEQARDSVRQLAQLEPLTVACGHGVPMSGPDVAAELTNFAQNFPMPDKGRYAPEPARADEHGITYLPPAPPDPLPNLAMGVGIVAVLGAVLAFKIKTDKS